MPAGASRVLPHAHCLPLPASASVCQAPADRQEAIQDLESLAHLRLAEITPCHGHTEGRSDLRGAAGGDARVVDSVSSRSSAAFGQMARHRSGGSADPSSGIGVLVARLSLRLRLRLPAPVAVAVAALDPAPAAATGAATGAAVGAAPGAGAGTGARTGAVPARQCPRLARPLMHPMPAAPLTPPPPSPDSLRSRCALQAHPGSRHHWRAPERGSGRRTAASIRRRKPRRRAVTRRRMAAASAAPPAR
jgi:hypothetical protein